MFMIKHIKVKHSESTERDSILVVLKRNETLIVMLGGFLGSIARFILGNWLYIGGGFPLSTLLINLIDCLFFGWHLTLVSQRKEVRPELVLFVGTGFIGSFTTFSTFSIETIQLFQNGFVFSALFYIFSTTIIGLILAYLGYKIAITKGERGINGWFG